MEAGEVGVELERGSQSGNSHQANTLVLPQSTFVVTVIH
jgi:hypothetical protein